MTEEKVGIDELIKCRAEIVEQLPNLLGEKYKDFLISMMEGKPSWEKLPYENIEDYPGVQWKLLNIKKMSTDKIKEEIRLIEAVFGN